MSAIGFGSAVGTLLLPWLSDRTGRRPIMIGCTIGAGAALICLTSLSGASIFALFLSLFAVHFFNNALITLTVGPVCSDTVPPTLTATASGVIIAAGEFFGGGLAPIVAGQTAERFGIGHVLWLPIGAMVAGLLLCVALRAPAALVVVQLPKTSG
jgi:MFS family permease